jgi:prophage antirepressor-like protein
MDEIKTFKNSEFGELNIIIEDGKEFFPATDCAKILGYAEPQNAVRRHCTAEGCVKRTGVSNTTNQHGTTTSQKVEKTYITEGNLYRLIVKSKLPEAEKFERWVFDEVLPSIRKHGLYAVDELLDNPDLAIRAFQALKEERQKRIAAESENAKLKPKAEFADRLLTSDDTILIGELAKILSKDGFKMGERTLFSYLRDSKILTKNNLPYQRFIDAGYFEVAERPINLYSGTILSLTTKVTPKGQHYIYKRLKKEAM